MAYYRYILGLALLLCGCQPEEDRTEQDTAVSFTKDSPLGILVSRVTQSPTSHDDFLDGSSCFSVKLPVVATVNGQQVNVNTTADYQDVIAILNQSSSDVDTVQFTFPITIIYPGYDQVSVPNQAALDAIKNACQADAYAEIECIDFTYPLTLNVYNTQNQAADVYDMDDDADFYNAIRQASASTVMSLTYPLVMTRPADPDVTVQTNLQLEQAIENSIGTCATSGPGPTPIPFPELIVTYQWRISYYYNQSDLTAQYSGYTFDFASNGTVTATNGSVTRAGEFEIEDDGGGPYNTSVEIEFEDHPLLENLEDDWQLFEYNNQTFRLKIDTGGGQIKHLYFTRI